MVLLETLDWWSPSSNAGQSGLMAQPVFTISINYRHSTCIQCKVTIEVGSDPILENYLWSQQGSQSLWPFPFLPAEITRDHHSLVCAAFGNGTVFTKLLLNGQVLGHLRSHWRKFSGIIN